MITRLDCISNSKIKVAYFYFLDYVIVEAGPDLFRIFSVYPGIYEMYTSFTNSFSEGIDFETACDFFTPNIAATCIN